MPAPLAFDIALAGLGISAPDHVTPEAERALRSCREILFLDTGVATRAFLERLAPRVTPLFEESYAEEALRLDAYAHMAVRVVEAALDHGPVGFALQGHPTVGLYAPALVRDVAGLLGLRVAVFPGISSIDALFAALGIDPFVQGLQAFEATDLLLRARPLRPEVPLLVWQAGSVESRLHTARPNRPERFARLVAHLLRTHPPGHEVVIFFASPHPLLPDDVHRVPLARLAEHADRLHAGATLLVPPVAERPIHDADLLAKLDDPAHLRRITR
jgi:precorrin-3B methylase